tara:strand:- start:14713 stop:16095 length:1383 start_codon:yes stop_codon:yes gene_type:complete
MARKGGRKTFTDSRGRKVKTTKWQKLVSQHGVEGAKKHYSGYSQRPVPPTTTGNVVSTKKGARRVKGNKIGGGKRSNLFYKGDKVGTWTKSGGNKTKGASGKSWFMDRGYGTKRNPVPDTPLARRLGIAGKTDLLTGHPSALYEDWEEDMDNVSGKKVSNAETAFDAELTMWQGLVKKHGMKGAKKHYAGYKQRPAPKNTTGQVRMTKSGPRRIKDSNIGGGKRSIITYKGDRVGTWAKSRGVSNKGGNSGLAWFMERGYGTARNPVPDTPLTRRLGIANKGRRLRDIIGRFMPGKNTMLTGHPNALYEDWETSAYEKNVKGKPIMEGIRNMVGLPVDDELKGTLAQRSVKARKKMGNPVNRRLTFSEVFGGDRDSLGKFAFGKMAESFDADGMYENDDGLMVCKYCNSTEMVQGDYTYCSKCDQTNFITQENMNAETFKAESFGAEIFDDVGYESENWE